MERLTSLFGMLIILAMAWIFSEARKAIIWKSVLGALVLELLLGALVFMFPQSTSFFLLVNRGVVKLLSLAGNGAIFLFGALALQPGETGPNGESPLGFFMAFQVLPAVIFFSALMALLYHLGAMQPMIRIFAKVFRRFMRLSGAEALCTSSNIFVGIEAVFSVRPYLKDLTRSEFFTILTACMATVASTTLAIYVSFLHEILPTIAGHLISASILAIPASVLISKMMIPELERPRTMDLLPTEDGKAHTHFMGAVSEGAWEGLKLAAGITALLIAVLGLVGILDAGISRIAAFCVKGLDLSLTQILGWLMIPFAWCLGIPAHDLFPAAKLLGERLVLTEVVAYRDLAAFAASGAIRELRSVVILSYALCGFTHVASVAIFVGGISALVPSRRDEIAGLGLKALLAAFWVTLFIGCIAGLFYTQSPSILLS